MKSNYELRAEARKALGGHWTTAVIITLVYMVCCAVFSSPSYFHNFAAIISLLLFILVVYPITFGYCVFALYRRRDQECGVGTLMDGFNNYGRVVLTSLLRSIYIYLWTLLLVVPGIVKSYSYAMTLFVLKDHPEMGCDEAIEASMAMMKGRKMKLFLLDLSFIGWMFLGVITGGIGLLWVAPYMAVARAAFYEDVKGEVASNDVA